MDGMMGGGAQDIWANLPPEQRQAALAQVLKLSGAGEKSELLKDELARAMGKQDAKPMSGYGLWGGIASGLNNIMSGIVGKVKEDRSRGELEKLMGQQQSGRDVFAQQLLGGGAGQQPNTGAPMSAPQSMNPAPPALQMPQQQQQGQLPPWLMPQGGY